MTKAKAAMLYAPQTIRIEEITLPDCGPKDVIVHLKKATLCPTDIKKYNAWFFRFSCSPPRCSMPCPICWCRSLRAAARRAAAAVYATSQKPVSIWV